MDNREISVLDYAAEFDKNDKFGPNNHLDSSNHFEFKLTEKGEDEAQDIDSFGTPKDPLILEDDEDEELEIDSRFSSAERDREYQSRPDHDSLEILLNIKERILPSLHEIMNEYEDNYRIHAQSEKIDFIIDVIENFSKEKVIIDNGFKEQYSQENKKSVELHSLSNSELKAKIQMTRKITSSIRDRTLQKLRKIEKIRTANNYLEGSLSSYIINLSK